MGDGALLPDGTSFCSGKDVVQDLNRWFGDVTSSTYRQARILQTSPKLDARRLFELGDTLRQTTDLAEAYGIVGQIDNPDFKIPTNWAIYLKSLHGAPAYDSGGLDGYDLIVKARADALEKNLPMWTRPHTPCEPSPPRVIITEEKLDLGNGGDPQVYKVFSVPYTAFGFGWGGSGSSW